MAGALTAKTPRSQGSLPADLALAAAVVVAITAVLVPIGELDNGVSSGVLYVLGVLLLAIYRGLRAGLIASIASAIALDYFHAAPVGQLGGKSRDDFVAIAVLLLTATVASVIANRARHRVAEAEYRLALEEELRKAEAERVRLREVHASRARVIQVADEQRRRIARDLHDGAQQRLVHTVLTLKLARSSLDGGHSRALAMVEEALANAQAATNELRELAHGILPAALVHGGLRNGVDAIASRMPVPVEMQLPATRLGANVEATAYFVVAEALTNVAKHSGASRAWVTGMIADGRLELQVRDDGVGGARSEGYGLLGMQDRLAALDGRLRLESPPGGGTRIDAEIPLCPTGGSSAYRSGPPARDGAPCWSA
jgi:signal transduction histidine kinase